jgi:hypothetical protein
VGVPAVTSKPAVTGNPAVTGISALAGIPAVTGMHAVTDIPFALRPWLMSLLFLKSLLYPASIPASNTPSAAAPIGDLFAVSLLSLMVFFLLYRTG